MRPFFLDGVDAPVSFRVVRDFKVPVAAGLICDCCSHVFVLSSASGRSNPTLRRFDLLRI